MNKFILHTTIAFVLLFLVLQLIKSTVPFYWGNENIGQKFTYLEELDYPFDTYFVGSSFIYRHVIPNQFDEACGTKSFNLGSEGMFNVETYYLIDHLVKELKSNDTIKIFLGPGLPKGIASTNLHSTRIKYCMDFKRFLYTIKLYYPKGVYKQIYRSSIAFLENLFLIGELEDIYDFHAKGAIEMPRFISEDRGFYAKDTEMLETNSHRLRQHNKNFNKKQNRLEKQQIKNAGKKKMNRNKKRGIVVKPFVNKLYDLNNRGGNVQYLVISGSEPIPTKYKFDRGHYNLEGAKIYTDALIEEYLKYVAYD